MSQNQKEKEKNPCNGRGRSFSMSQKFGDFTTNTYLNNLPKNPRY